MDPPSSPTRSKSATQKQLLASFIAPITALYPDYQNKISALHFHKELIITNPKAFVNLFESQQFNGQKSEPLLLEGWLAVTEFVANIFRVMPINATFVFKEASFVVFVDGQDQLAGYKTVNAVEYIINKIFVFLERSSKLRQQASKSDDEEEKMKLRHLDKKILELIGKLYVLYHFFMQNSCIPAKTLNMITKLLCNKFYSSTLTIKMLQIAHSMFSQLNDSSISSTETGNLQPFLYFNGSAKIGLRLLITNNKWPFNKGMHLCVWMKSFLELQPPAGYIMFLKVDERNWFVLRQERGELVVESSVEGDRNKRRICDFPIRALVKFEVALEPKESGGIFKSNTEYRLHLRVNGQETKNVEIKIPRFDNSDFVTEFNMFGEYVGQFYSLALWKSTGSYSLGPNILPDTLESEAEVNSFLESSPQMVEEMLTLLTPLRVHKGILVNMVNSELNHACHEATILLNEQENKNNRYLTCSSQILLPFLYFTVKLWREATESNGEDADEVKFECEKFINIVIQEYCKSRAAYCEETQNEKKLTKVKNSILENYKLTTLFILYWLENTEYPINEATLGALLELTLASGQNYQPLLLKYLDRNLLTAKNLKLEELYTKIKGKKKLASLEEGSELEPCNPVTKLQLLFYLETSWRELWNKYQYMTEWWEPLNLRMQNDKPFDKGQFVFVEESKEGLKDKSKEKEGPSHPWIEWTVSEFITNDFCDCLILPVILEPNYCKLGEPQSNKPSPFIFNRYQQMYSKKQCMTEDFSEPGLLEAVLDKEESTKYYFKKVVKSLFGKIMEKVNPKQKDKEKQKEKQKQKSDTIQSKSSFQISGKKIMKAFSGEEELNSHIKFQTDASYLNLLTLIIGTMTIEMRGKSAFICFSQKHASKILDHMCVKAYKNEDFIYICIDLGDVRVVKRRRFNQSMNGMEIRLKSGHGYLFYFHERNIDKFISFLKQNTKNAKNRVDTVFKDPYDEYLASNHTTLWIDKKVSNWEYLQWLNDIAGRSYNDITQYPVLPWVFVEDSKSPEAAIKNEKSYRDLTKNMGSFGPQDRIQHFLDKYHNAGEHEIFSEYHFGTHYSSSAIIFNYLIRLRPFSVGAVTLQSGKFDCADRVFSSYMGSWANATNSPTDLRELIPEIFLLPEMMVNINGYDFGLTQLKERICNVEMPKWCEGNPYTFCKFLRKSLESEVVSQKINNWIDLIYGYKQKGPAAVESMNIFFPLTYELAINMDKIGDPEEKISIETQVAHFGQNPAQIIGSSPHPLKSAIKQKWENKLLADCNEIIIQRCSLTRMNSGEVKFIFQSVFEDKNSILAIKFLTDNVFIVLRRYQFCLFKILDNKSGFISKEKEIDFVTEKDNISLDYQNISTYVPMVTAIHRLSKLDDEEEDGLTGTCNLAIVGGFYNGTLQIIYLNDVKASGTLRMPFSTVTALAYCQEYSYLYVGDSQGRLGVYKLHIKHPFSPSKELELAEKFHQQVHDLKISNISINSSANLFLTASQDGTVKLFNLYSQQLYRKIVSPSRAPIVFAKISTCPLYCIVFYSEENSLVYSYSINGQYLSCYEDTTGFIYNMAVLQATDHCESLVYLNAHREIYILELPELKIKKKIRLKKDEHKISCFVMTNQIAIAGSQDGALQIIADPSSF